MTTPSSSDFIVFTRYFVRYAALVRHILFGLLLLITLFGVVISFLEDLHLGEGIYFAFITALTIGYGDINAASVLGRIMCVLTGLVGMLFTGMTVAVANRALQSAAAEQMKKDGGSTVAP